MEAVAIVAVIAVLIGVVIAVALTQRSRTARSSGDGSEGSTPQSDVKPMPVSEPAQSGQVTPGAATPAAAGSPQAFYDDTRVGAAGPRHVGTPPSVATLGPSETTAAVPSSLASETGPASVDSQDSWLAKLPVVLTASGTAAVGLGVLALVRSRARRRGPVEQLRGRVGGRLERAGRLAGDARESLADASAVAADRVDARAGAGGTLALVFALALFAAIRRRQQETQVEQVSATARQQATTSALSAGRRGMLWGRRGANWLDRQTERADRVGAARDTIKQVPSKWLVLGGGLTLAAVTALAIRLRQRPEDSAWSFPTSLDSAPGHETPASP
jgi:hypothetical protein